VFYSFLICKLWLGCGGIVDHRHQRQIRGSLGLRELGDGFDIADVSEGGRGSVMVHGWQSSPPQISCHVGSREEHSKMAQFDGS
jgi:hypothetical protein